MYGGSRYKKDLKVGRGGKREKAMLADEKI